MNNYRVAWLLPTAWFYWQPLLNEFTNLFPQTKVFTGLWPGFAKGFEDSFKVEVVGNQAVLPIKPGIFDYGSNFTYLSPRIVSRLLQFKPHIIFASSFGVWTVLALLFKSLGKWKVIIAYEGSSPSVDYCDSPIRLAIRRTMVQAADACITNSQAGKAYLLEFLQAKENSVFAQPYETPDVQAWLKPSEDFQLDISSLRHPIFLFVGSIIPRKGLQILLQAFSLLQKQGFCDFSLLIIGEGPQREQLQIFSENHDLTEYLQWLGKVDYAKLGDYFRNADVFILPTLEDTWGMVVLEAMAVGKPVICSKAAGAAELIIDGENGYRYNPNDPKELAGIIRSFSNNPDLLVSMGGKSKQIMAQYTPEFAAKYLSKIIFSIIQ